MVEIVEMPLTQKVVCMGLLQAVEVEPVVEQGVMLLMFLVLLVVLVVAPVQAVAVVVETVESLVVGFFK